MADQHLRFAIPGASVAWELWTFWHWFKGGRVGAEASRTERRHTLMHLGSAGLQFTTAKPPDDGARLALNVFVPGEATAYVVRGVVMGIKPHSEKQQPFRVKVKFEVRPTRLLEKMHQAGQVAV